MKPLDLFRYNSQVHRLLDSKDDKALIINCEKVSMPFWIDFSSLDEDVTEDFFLSIDCIDTLSPENRKIAQFRFTLISPILPFVSDDYMRSLLINQISNTQGISKQTIRKYLCVYLVYQNISCLAPKEKSKKLLSQDEKNFRWALNRYYYSYLKHTVKGTYFLMLKDKYTDRSGNLIDGYPPFHRFRYFYTKTKNEQNRIISREGLSKYKRNYRPLVNGGVNAFANSIGVGMFDSTILDIYLINEAKELVGRPYLTACVDAYSGLCCGYALTWEGGVYSIKCLLFNIIADKVAWCKQFGIDITKDDWNCTMLPATFMTDKGREYTSYALEQITDLGVNIVNLPPYRPDLKSCVEQFFNVIQNLYKPHLKGKGVIESDYQERGAIDYRKTASLTLKQLETIILKCIVYYNTERIVERISYGADTIVKPYSNEIWNDSMVKPGANLIEVDKELLTLTLLPRTKATFTRKGLLFRKLHYFADGFTNEYLNGGSVDIAYNPDSISNIWLLKNSGYIKFSLIDNLEDMSFDFASKALSEKEQYLKTFESNEIKARISLIGYIETISNLGSQTITTKAVRKTRSKEKQKERKDL